MKKSLCLSFVLMAAGVLTFPWAIGKVNSQKESVRVTETVLWGDSREAEGIWLEADTHWADKLLWNIRLRPGHAEEAESTFSFYGSGIRWKEKGTEFMESMLCSGLGIAGAVDSTGRAQEPEAKMDGQPGEKMLRAVAERTAAGEIHTEVVALADYYEYYPLQFEAVCEEKGLYEQVEWTEELSEYFGLRVPEGEQYRVTVEKNREGLVTAFQYDSLNGGYGLENCWFYGSAGCYYGFYAEGEEAGEDSYLYYLPYREDGSLFGEDLSADIGSFRKASRLPEGMKPIALAMDSMENWLYVTAENREGYFLLIYRAEDGSLEECGRQLLLPETEDGRFVQMTVREEGILFTWDDNGFVFAAGRGEDCRVWCRGIFSGNVNFPYENAFDFDGERLALAAFDGWESLDTRLEVYRGGELVYSGLFQYSQRLDGQLGLRDREAIQVQGASFGRLRRMGAACCPIRVDIGRQGNEN